jgi:AraC-like DNA-binding protein
MKKSSSMEKSLARRPTILYRAPVPGAPMSVTELGEQTVRSLIHARTLAVLAGVLVEAGRGSLDTAPTGRQPIVAPSLFWLIPGVRHTYGPLPGTAWDERWVLFSGRLVDHLLSGGLIEAASPIVPLRQGSEVPGLFAALSAEVRLHSPLGDAAAAATVGRLVTRAAIEARRGAAAGTEGDALVRELRERAIGQLDIAGFAAASGVSPATLRRRFLAATGMPPKAFQLRVRLDRAKELLATAELSIAEVAAAVGLEDPFYFARLFQQREKCAPTEFRNRHHRR